MARASIGATPLITQPSPWIGERHSTGLRKSPLALFTLLVLVGQLVRLHYGPASLLVFVVLGLVAVRFARALWFRQRPLQLLRRLWLLLPLCLGVLIGVPARPEAVSVDRGFQTVEGTVAVAPRVSAHRGAGDLKLSSLIVLEAVAIDGQSRAGELRLRVAGASPLVRGDRVRASLWGNRRHRVQRIRHPSHLVSVEPAQGVRAAVARLRLRLIERVQARYSARAAGLIGAFLLGERRLLSTDLSEALRDIGQGHLLAISGLHVGLIGLVVSRLLALIPERFGRIRTVFLGLVLLLFAALSGSQAPAVRAVVFGLLGLLSFERRSPGASLQWTALAYLGFCWFSPLSLRSASFQISFAAILGILLLGPRKSYRPRLDTNPTRRIGRNLRRSLGISYAAWWGASAALVFYSIDVTPLAPLLTLLLLPLLTLSISLGLIALLPIAGIEFLLDRPLFWLHETMTEVSFQLGHLPGTPSVWPALPAGTLALLVLSIAGLRMGRRLGYWSHLFLVVAGLTVLGLPRDSAELCDLGRGQALLVVTPDSTLLFDAGSLDRRHGGADQIAKALRRVGRARIDALFLSHPHADHILAVPELLDRTQIARVFVSRFFGDEPLGAQLLEHLDLARIPVVAIEAGHRVLVGATPVRVLHPRADRVSIFKPNVNDDSLVLKVEDLDLLVPGDIEARGLLQLTSEIATTLVLPHHGRPEPGTLTRLLDWQPQRVIASSSPGVEVSYRPLLYQNRIEFWETAVDGPIRIKTRPP